MPTYYMPYSPTAWITGTSTTTVTPIVYTNIVCTTASTAPTYAMWQTPTNRLWVDSRAYYDNSAQVIDRQRRVVESHKYEARQRAKELLLEHLTPAQQETFTKNNWFVVEGSKTHNRYRIHARADMIGNIDVLDSGRYSERVMHRLCGHCDLAKYPLGDQLLAQKMMLEYAEDDFLKVANRHAA